MSISIRKATVQDFPAVFHLIKKFAFFQQATDKVSITLEQMIEDKEYFQCLVAETASKEIVGFATFFYAYYSWSGKAVYLDDLYVTESFRKQGIGKDLLLAIIDLAKEGACKKVRWQVSKWNTAAIGFYEKMGATIDEVEINCDYLL